MNIAYPSATANGLLVTASSRDADFYVMLMGNTPLAGTKSLATAVENHMKTNFDIATAKIYFKMKNENFDIDGQDAFTGLPSGDTYQIVVVPQGVKWKPPIFVPAPRKALDESCPLLSMPALPPYLYQKINGTAPPPKAKSVFAPK